jgi:hypothetical protein
MAQPSVSPRGVEWTLFGSGTFSTEVQISKITSAAQLTATVSLADTEALNVRIAQITVSRFVAREMLVELQPGELPPGADPEDFPPGFQTVWDEAVLRLIEGSGPVEVEAGEVVKIVLIAQATSANFMGGDGVLLITGDTWDPIPVPLTFLSGSEVTFTLTPAQLTVEQGGVATTTVTARWESGPAVDLQYHMIEDGEAYRVSMEPAVVSLRIQPGETKTTVLTFRIQRDCFPDRKALRIVQSGAFVWAGSVEKRFQLDVTPPPPPPTLDRSLAIQKIHEEYLRTGGFAGPLGFPMTEVKLNRFDNTATRFYRGGRVEAKLADGPIGVVTQAIVTHKAVVTLLGIRCVRESDHDQLSPTDEPYFVVAIENFDGMPKVQKLGPFENTETGREIGSGATWTVDNLTPNPMSIRVQAYEHDHGDPDKTARNLQEQFVELAREAQSIAGASGADAADGAGIGPTTAAGVVGALAGPLGTLLAVGIVQALGLGDDYIGQGSRTLFARPELVGTEPGRLGSFQGQDYNVMIDINGGGEGHYQLFFFVDGRKITEE